MAFLAVRNWTNMDIHSLFFHFFAFLCKEKNYRSFLQWNKILKKILTALCSRARSLPDFRAVYDAPPPFKEKIVGSCIFLACYWLIRLFIWQEVLYKKMLEIGWILLLNVGEMPKGIVLTVRRILPLKVDI